MTSWYTGAVVSKTFMDRWRSAQHVGPARPWMEVAIRRGRFKRTWHNNWPNPQFGQVVGQAIRHQWYADWHAEEDWIVLDGAYQVSLAQSFDNNGIATATIDLDNVAWQDTVGANNMVFRTKQRGIYWPWRGWTPSRRPGSGQAKNNFYNYLPNAQIRVRQGYGPDTAIKTFTGLVDAVNASVRPDRVTLQCRDFGGVLADEYLFGWNKTHGINDPITFVPKSYWRLPWVEGDGKTHRWIKIKDSTEIVMAVLRWAGFKEWEIEKSGVDLMVPYTVDKTNSYMDVINAVKEQLGYVFFMGEPTVGEDLSLGVPVFRRSSPLVAQRASKTVVNIRGQDYLTDHKPVLSNTNDRYIIRVRGVINQKVGRYLDNPANGGDTSSDTAKRLTFQYWPPWMPQMAGVIKQLTYYNVGSQGVLGFTSQKDCVMACVLIAYQIALGRWTDTAECPGLPAVGLDSFVYVTDQGTGVASRLYVTNRQSTMAVGGDGTTSVNSGYGSGGASGNNELIWGTQIGGSLIDNPETDHVVSDFHRAQQGKSVFSWDSTE